MYKFKQRQTQQKDIEKYMSDFLAAPNITLY